MVKLKEGERIRYRCHTGHSFSASAFLSGVSESVEETLWQAMRGLEETTMSLWHMGTHMNEAGDSETASLFFKKALQTADRARVVHDSVFEQELISGNLQYQSEVRND